MVYAMEGACVRLRCAYALGLAYTGDVMCMSRHLDWLRVGWDTVLLISLRRFTVNSDGVHGST